MIHNFLPPCVNIQHVILMITACDVSWRRLKLNVLTKVWSKWGPEKQRESVYVTTSAGSAYKNLAT